MATTTSNATPTPALPPPPGTTSNFDNPATLKGSMDIAMGVAIPLTTIFFFLRAYVRIFIKRQWIGEDCKQIPARYSQLLGDTVEDTGQANRQDRARSDCICELRLSIGEGHSSDRSAANRTSPG